MKSIEAAKETIKRQSLIFSSVADSVEKLDPRRLTTLEVKNVFTKVVDALRTLAQGEVARMAAIDDAEAIITKTERARKILEVRINKLEAELARVQGLPRDRLN